MRPATSSEKQTLAQLAAKRQIIKQKFKEAYGNRQKSERKILEAFKPIERRVIKLAKTSSTKEKKIKIPKPFEYGNDTDGHNADYYDTTSDEQIYSEAESSPDLDISNLFGEANENENADDDEVPDAVGAASFVHIPKVSPKKSPKRSPIKKKKISPKKTPEKNPDMSSQAMEVGSPFVRVFKTPLHAAGVKRKKEAYSTQPKSKAFKGVDRYTYKIKFANESLDKYANDVDPELMVNAYRTDNLTGQTKPVSVHFKNLPDSGKEEFLQKRNVIKNILQNKDSPRVRLFRTPVGMARGSRRIAGSDSAPSDVSDVERLVRNINRRANESARKKAEQQRERDREMRKHDSNSSLSVNWQSEPGPNASTGAIRKKKKQGGGVNKSLDFDFIPYHKNNRIIYEYFDDPNELCSRLRLLVASRMAGNTNHTQEINSIIEELRELGHIVN